MELSPRALLVFLSLSSVLSAPLNPCWEENKAYVGFPLKKPGGNNDYGLKASVEECQAQCQAVEGCAWWNWDQDKHCWLKTKQGKEKPVKNSVTGPRNCPVPREEQKVTVDWTDWSEWGPCSKSCVGNDLVPGEKVRQRSCRGLLRGGQPYQDGITPCNTDRERLPCYGETTKVNICPSPAQNSTIVIAERPTDDTRKILGEVETSVRNVLQGVKTSVQSISAVTSATPPKTTTRRSTTPTTGRQTTPTTPETSSASPSFLFSCASNPCHSSAECSDTSSGFTCRCKLGQAGDPYQAGCKDKDLANYEDIVVLFGLL